jgi:hypothetical protein
MLFGTLVLQIILNHRLGHVCVLPWQSKPDSVPGVIHVAFEVPDVFRIFGLGVRSGISSPHRHEFSNEKFGNAGLPSPPGADFGWILEGPLDPL